MALPTVRDVKPADNMYPSVPHPEQDAAARAKLAELARKSGKKPNVLVFIMDDVGWMDPGFNGGGVAVGNDTPTMDRLAHDDMLPKAREAIEKWTLGKHPEAGH